jgi:uncharacterized protein (DUF2236 family)
VKPPVSWIVHRERLLLLGWGRAILLQFAHPLIARAVFEHSGFRDDRLGGWRRLHRTVWAMLFLTFGSEPQAAAAAGRINAIHARVKGRADGLTYAANDPDLMRWVHVTCVDSFLRAYELYVGPLTSLDRDAYCAESADGAALLGIDPHRLPHDHHAVQECMDAMYESGTLRVTEAARALARAVLYPKPRWLGWPVVGAVRRSTVALLPPAIRDAYGLPWSPREQRRFDRLVVLVRTLRGWAPSWVAHWAIARKAMRRRADRDAITPVLYSARAPRRTSPGGPPT